jgi:hypothetical protein
MPWAAIVPSVLGTIVGSSFVLVGPRAWKALSVYGLGRFPVTLYKEQWRRVLGMANEIEAYIQENDSKLKTKE